MPCPNSRKGGQSCSCVPPLKNRSTARLIYGLAISGAVLLLLFNNLKGYQHVSLEAQSVSMIAVLGFLTGLHCIGMCGGFMMSYIKEAQSRGMSNFEMHSKYALAKVSSYTFFGALFGGLGALVFFSNNFKAAASIIGGLILLYLGGRGLGLFRRWNIWKQPQKSLTLTGPVGVGAMKGLMISCGPLQALYLLSASQGNMGEGALMLAVFGLGTLPIFLLYGTVVSTLTWFKAKWADIVTSAIVVMFGVMMLGRGAALGGLAINPFSCVGAEVHANDEFNKDQQKLYMEVSRRGYSRNQILFEAEKPICWEIFVHEITNCNRTIEIPQYNISRELNPGFNYIEFDPKEDKTVVFTCWMGMMKGSFTVLNWDADSLSLAQVLEQ